MSLEELETRYTGNDRCSDSSDDEPLSNLTKKKTENTTIMSKSEDEPLSNLKKVKTEPCSDSDSDDEPLSNLKIKKEEKVGNVSSELKRKNVSSKSTTTATVEKKRIKTEKSTTTKTKTPPSKSNDKNSIKKEGGEKKKKKKEPTKKKVKQETELQKKRRLEAEKEEAEKYKWWLENEKVELEEGQRWQTLEHNTPLLAPEYVPLPKYVKFYYDGKPVDLQLAAEEVCGFYAAMIKTDYASNPVFIKNFFKDWRTFMTANEKSLIKDFALCDFSKLTKYFDEQREIKKAFTKEQKKAIKLEKEKEVERHGIAIVDGHKEKVGNFRVEPPGLFRGRGDHPKMGFVKTRVLAKDITINIGKGAKVPMPPPGQKWKEVIHNDHVTWLATWTENVQGNIKYVMLNANSRMKGEQDMKKYDKARELKKHVNVIREKYVKDFKDPLMEIRQRATAMYFIDRLALRAGNEKNTDEEADTVGCCSLRVEHIELKDDFKIAFDFLGKDSIRYHNEVIVTERVWKNCKIFIKNKKPEHPLFDRISVPSLNKHLQDQMSGLTAKVFRTYNASWTLQQELNKSEDSIKNASPQEKVLAYNRANRAVAILCNHQRAAPKSYDAQMEKMKDAIKGWKSEMRKIKNEKQAVMKEKESKNSDKKVTQLKKKLNTLKERIRKKEIAMTDKEENKTIALGTSKINYMDPRVTIAWCKRNDVPVEKCYSKTHRDKFQWAMPIEKGFQW